MAYHWITVYYIRQSRCKVEARSSKIDCVFSALRSIATARYCSLRHQPHSKTPCSILVRPTFRDCSDRILMHVDLQPLSTRPTTIIHHDLHNNNQRRLSASHARPTTRPTTRNRAVHEPIFLWIWVWREQQKQRRSEKARRQRLVGSARVEDHALGKRGREDLPPSAGL